MNWLLLIIAVFVALSILDGYRRGFIKTVFSMLAMLIALVVASAGSPTLCHVLEKNDGVYNFINQKVSDTLEISSRVSENSEQTAVIESLPLPESVKQALEDNNNDVIKELLQVSKNDFAGYITGYITCLILNAISYIILFVLTLIVVQIVANILDIISRLPVLHSINKTGGLIVGFLKGIIAVWIFFVILTIFGGTEFGKNMFEMINDSKILSYIYSHNMLLDIVLGVTKTLI